MASTRSSGELVLTEISSARSLKSGATSSIPSSPRRSEAAPATAVTSSSSTPNCGARVSRRNATAQPASAPRRYAVGLGARFSPPSTPGRSASQLNGPADRRARPLASVAVTLGRDIAFDGSARKRLSVAEIVEMAIDRSSRGPPGWELPRPYRPEGRRRAAAARNSRGSPTHRLAADTQLRSGAPEEAGGRAGARGATGQAELQVDVRKMSLDRARAEAQLVGDLLVRPAVGADAE